MREDHGPWKCVHCRGVSVTAMHKVPMGDRHRTAIRCLPSGEGDHPSLALQRLTQEGPQETEFQSPITARCVLNGHWTSDPAEEPSPSWIIDSGEHLKSHTTTRFRIIAW